MKNNSQIRFDKQIKFRIWSLRDKKFITDEYEVFNRTLNPIFENKDIVFQRFTGFFDNKGKEIYEGDIIKSNYNYGYTFTGKVIFDFGAFMLESKTGGIFQDFYFTCKHGEVIGNIFENSTLLL